jgi:hypothetical protein
MPNDVLGVLTHTEPVLLAGVTWQRAYTDDAASIKRDGDGLRPALYAADAVAVEETGVLSAVEGPTGPAQRPGAPRGRLL